VLEVGEMVEEMIEKLISSPTIHPTSFTDYL